jgi:hypothetical protein
VFTAISPDDIMLRPPPVTVIVDPSNPKLSIFRLPNVPILTKPVAVVTVDASSVLLKTVVPSIL